MIQRFWPKKNWLKLRSWLLQKQLLKQWRAPEVTETVLEQRPEMDAISTELPAKIKFGPTPTEPIVEAEDLPEETPSNAGKRIKAVLYSTLGLAMSVRPFCNL